VIRNCAKAPCPLSSASHQACDGISDVLRLFERPVKSGGKRESLFFVEECAAFLRRRTNVACQSLDPKHANCSTADEISHGSLRLGIASAERWSSASRHRTNRTSREADLGHRVRWTPSASQRFSTIENARSDASTVIAAPLNTCQNQFIVIAHTYIPPNYIQFQSISSIYRFRARLKTRNSQCKLSSGLAGPIRCG
jgi:hypothetical protein